MLMRAVGAGAPLRARSRRSMSLRCRSVWWNGISMPASRDALSMAKRRSLDTRNTFEMLEMRARRSKSSELPPTSWNGTNGSYEYRR